MQFIFLPLTFIVFNQTFDSANQYIISISREVFDPNIHRRFDLLQIIGHLISVASGVENLENKYFCVSWKYFAGNIRRNLRWRINYKKIFFVLCYVIWTFICIFWIFKKHGLIWWWTRYELWSKARNSCHIAYNFIQTYANSSRQHW